MAESPQKTAYRVVIEGRVTGVGFRFAALHQAARIGNLQGSIRNAGDRTVECIVQGPPAAVAEMLAWLRHGPPTAIVTSVKITEEPVRADRPPFRIVA